MPLGPTPDSALPCPSLCAPLASPGGGQVCRGCRARAGHHCCLLRQVGDSCSIVPSRDGCLLQAVLALLVLRPFTSYWSYSPISPVGLLSVSYLSYSPIGPRATCCVSRREIVVLVLFGRISALSVTMAADRSGCVDGAGLGEWKQSCVSVNHSIRTWLHGACELIAEHKAAWCVCVCLCVCVSQNTRLTSGNCLQGCCPACKLTSRTHSYTLTHAHQHAHARAHTHMHRMLLGALASDCWLAIDGVYKLSLQVCFCSVSCTCSVCLVDAQSW